MRRPIVLPLAVACSATEGGVCETRNRNDLPTLIGLEAVSKPPASSWSDEVSGERSDSSPGWTSGRTRSGVEGIVNNLSTSSVESTTEESGVKERGKSWTAKQEGSMVGHASDQGRAVSHCTLIQVIFSTS